MTWHLKKPDGTHYGPVTLAQLQEWAASGRILPEDEVSPDGETWRPAPEQSELGMDWLVLLADDGRYGPVHPLTLLDLLQEGSLSAGSFLEHKATRALQTVGDLLLPLVTAQAAARQADLAASAARAAAAEQAQELALRQVADLGAELEAQKTARENGQKRIADLETEVEHWKLLTEEQRTARVQSEEELNGRIKALRESELALQSRLEAAQAAPPPPPAAEGAEDKGLMASYHDLARNYDSLLAQFTAKGAELKAAVEANATYRREGDERMARLEETLRREREEADNARQRLAQGEEIHLELVKSYRELNDRYIRLRQKNEILPPSAPPVGSAIREDAPSAPRPPQLGKPRLRLF